MISFIHTRGHGFELREIKKSPQLPAVKLMDYDALFKKSRLPFSTYIFTDMERLGFWDLELAGHLCAQLKNAGLKTLNNPARAKNRFTLLKALHAAGLNDFNVHRAEELPASIRFPVFLRKMQGHALPLSGLLDTRAELEQSIEAAIVAGIPATNQIAVEYAGEPVREGLYRKLAAFRIGEKIIPYLCGHDTDWYVKAGKKGIAGEELYREERDIIQTNPHAKHLRKVFDLAEIEFGRADYGFYNGRIQVFEINTNPLLKKISPHPSPLRHESMRVAWENITTTLREIDSGDGVALRLRKDKMYRYQKWSLGNLFSRSRKVD